MAHDAAALTSLVPLISRDGDAPATRPRARLAALRSIYLAWRAGVKEADWEPTLIVRVRVRVARSVSQHVALLLDCSLAM